jgi:hypothetical protein
MKYNIVKKILLPASVVIFAGGMQAQSQAPAMPAPRLAAPMIIPAAPGDVPATVSVQQTNQPARAAPAPSETRVSRASQNNATPDLGFDNVFKDDMVQAAWQFKATQAAASNAGASGVSEAAALRAEMVARMRMAVEQIAAEYGNPTFAQVFTNDAVQARMFRKRVQLLHRAEAINAEIAELEKQKVVAKGELDTVRRELAALQEQADALTNRLTKARTMLGMNTN